MNKIIMSAVLALTSTLGACNSGAVKTELPEGASQEELRTEAKRLKEDLAALTTCPADQIVDLDAFMLDLPELEGSEEAFHKTMGERESVMTLPSGLQYTVVKSGTGNRLIPKPEEVVRVNYHGVFPTGEKFDSSFDRGEPTEFPLNRVISGWTEGVGLMRPCDAWTFYIPSDLAYGPQGRPGIPGGASLVFHVQLLEIK